MPRDADGLAIGLATPETLDSLWPHCLPHLARLRERDENRRAPSEWRRLIEGGERQLWFATVPGKLIAVAITSLEVGDVKRCVLRAAAGEDMAAWAAPGMRAIEAWARAEGCQGMEFNGRPGWTRALWRLGYRPAFVICRKDL